MKQMGDTDITPFFPRLITKSPIYFNNGQVYNHLANKAI